MHRLRRIWIALLLVAAPPGLAQDPSWGKAKLVRVGETVQGTIEASGATQVFELEAETDETVTITLDSFDFDALLRIETKGADETVEDDDGGVETNARLVLQARAGVCYRLTLIAKEAGSGELSLSIAAGEAPPLENEALADAAVAFRRTAAARALEQGDKGAALRHLKRAGWLLVKSRKSAEAEAPFEAFLELSREVDGRVGEARALGDLGNVFYSLGDYPKAREHHEQSLALARELGDRAGEAQALRSLGNVFFRLGDYPKAREHYEQSLALARELGDRAEEAKALRSLGNVFFRLGDYPKAREHYEQSLALARELGDRAEEAKALGNLGSVFKSLGDYAKAQEHHEQSLALARELGDRAGEAAAFGGLGIVFEFLGDYAKAREHYERHLALARELGDRSGEAGALGNLGLVFKSLGDYAKAREHHERHLALARELGDRAGEARALGNLGLVFKSLGDYAKAREHHERHLALARELGDRVGEARALGNLGNVFFRLGDYAKAREHHERHLALARELGARAGEAQALGNLGNDFKSLGDYAKAREHHEQSLALARELGNRAVEAAAIANLGNVFYSLGDYAKAREHYEQSLALARELGDRAGEAQALGNLGSVFSSLGDYAKAREHHEQSLALARELGDRAGEARALGNLGNVFKSLGDYAKAREHYERNLALARELGGRAGEAAAIANLGIVFSSLGDYAKAREHYERHLALARQLGDRAGEAIALGNLGVVFHSLEDYAKAREHHGQHLALARELGDRAGEARALGNLGAVYYSLGDHAKAREHHEQHFALERELGARAGEARALGNLGTVYHSLGDYAKAREFVESSLSLYGDLAVEAGRIHSLSTFAHIVLRERDSMKAACALEEATLVLDRIPTDTLEHGEVAGMRSSFSSLAELFGDLTALRVEETAGDPEGRDRAIAEGFERAGRWKGRALLAGIAEHRSGGRSAEATRLRRERREVLVSRDSALESVSRAIQNEEPSSAIDARRAEAQVMLSRAEELARRLVEVSPRDAALDLSVAVPVEDVRRVLPRGTALFDYVEGEERLYVYVVTEKALDFVDLGEWKPIREAVGEFVASTAVLESLGSTQEVVRKGRALFEALLAPALRAAGDGIDRLAIVPTTALSGVAFEALVLGTNGTSKPRSFAEVEFVLDRYQVSYAPSSSVLVELERYGPPRPGGKVLVLADPRYPAEGRHSTAAASEGALAGPEPEAGAARFGWQRLAKTREEARVLGGLLEREGRSNAEALQRLLGQRDGSLSTDRFDLHVGAEASRARLAADLRPYSVLHLAAHGYAGREFPQKTGLVLSFDDGDDGYFTVGDVLDLDLDANLVVLSACETARGEVRPGEGIESVARAFMYAGARGVVASLWQVADWSAAEMTREFYASWLAGETTPAQALRKAKQAVRGSRALRGLAASGPAGGTHLALESGHPFFWAPFIHLGLPR